MPQIQIPVLSGVYADANAEFRTSYPRNLVPVVKDQGISKGYLRPAEGVEQFGVGPGIDRGGINWNGTLYRVMGTSLVSVASDGTVTTLGDVGGTGPVTLDYSFDRLAITSGGSLFYWDGATLTRVSDPDLGRVIDHKWISGYFLTTDGTSLVVTDLNDPTSVNPLKYGSAESDPDPILAVDELRNEAYAAGRYTWEVFQNVGGNLFPFERVAGAQVTKGIVGTHAYCNVGNTFIFMGSGRNEAVAVYRMIPGDVEKVSTREIDTILDGYTEAQLAEVVAECRVDKDQQQVLFHLPDRTLCYGSISSGKVGEPVWWTLDSGVVEPAAYRMRNAVRVYDKWIGGDVLTGKLGVLTSSTAEHFGEATGWQFGTLIVYAEGNDAIIHELELVALAGRVASGANPVIWTQYSVDGETWSQERSTRAGRAGQRMQRICWRTQGTIHNQRMQRFRGTSDAFLSIARLQASLEALMTRPAYG
mgnify:FL=1